MRVLSGGEIILNRYIIISLFLIIIFYLCGINVSAQNKTILIFDPDQISTNFQNSFHQLSSDSVFIADTLDENINNFDALFLFIGYPFVLSEEEGNRLIEYLNLHKPIYLYTNLYWQDIDSVAFWNDIGIFLYAETLAEVQVDSVFGVDTAFTKGIVIDTSFISPGAPHIEGYVSPILDGMEYGFAGLHSTFIPENDSLRVIIDLYRFIHFTQFLEKVLIHFGLEEPSGITEEIINYPNEFYLHQNYPNPFNPSTSIQYEISSRQFVSLKVYDVLGNEVATLVNEEKLAGTFEVKFNGGGLPSGIYFYQLIAQNYIKTLKMMFIK